LSAHTDQIHIQLTGNSSNFRCQDSREYLIRSNKPLRLPIYNTAALRATTDSLLHDFNSYGFLFESLCIRDLRVYAKAIDGENLKTLRDKINTDKMR